MQDRQCAAPEPEGGMHCTCNAPAVHRPRVLQTAHRHRRRFPFSALIGSHSGISRFSGSQGRQTSRLSGSFAYADPVPPSVPVILGAMRLTLVEGKKGHGAGKITHLRDNPTQEVVALQVERRLVARLPSDVVSQP